METHLELLQEKMRDALDPQRYLHTVGVRYTAAALAMAHGVDLVKAQTAGILHDCAKGVSAEERLRLCRKAGIGVTKAEEKNPSLLHAKLGAYLAETRYGVTDPEILSAIRFHTTGRADMTPLEEIIFVADFIEPGRPPYDGIEEARAAAFCDLRRAVACELAATIDSVRRRSLEMDDTTLDAFEYYRSYLK